MTVNAPPELMMALNSALSERATIMARQSLMRGSSDSSRPCAWDSFGYKESLCFSDFYRMFERGGIAHGAIMTLTEACWSEDPQVIEGSEEDRAENPTPWEESFKKLAVNLLLTLIARFNWNRSRGRTA